MIKIPFYKISGEKSEDLALKIDAETLKLNKSLVGQALRVEENRICFSNGKTQTKGDVSGGGKKPWKQKGTGRARAGSSRSPLWKGGGVTFGPTGENKVLTIPKRMKQLAFAQLLVRKIQMKDVCAIESLELKSAKTKSAQELTVKIAKNKRITLVVAPTEVEKIKQWNNIALVETIESTGVKLVDFVKNRQIIFTKQSFEEIAKRVENV
jgi:large subunit ribosomal protein L4